MISHLPSMLSYRWLSEKADCISTMYNVFVFLIYSLGRLRAY